MVIVSAVATAGVLGILQAERLILLAPTLNTAFAEADFGGSFALSLF